jgi:hypothetical protein
VSRWRAVANRSWGPGLLGFEVQGFQVLESKVFRFWSPGFLGFGVQGFQVLKSRVPSFGVQGFRVLESRIGRFWRSRVFRF